MLEIWCLSSCHNATCPVFFIIVTHTLFCHLTLIVFPVMQVRVSVGDKRTALRVFSTTLRTMCCCRTREPSACAAGIHAQPRGRTCSPWATITSCAVSSTHPPTPASWPAATTSEPDSGIAAPPLTKRHLCALRPKRSEFLLSAGPKHRNVHTVYDFTGSFAKAAYHLTHKNVFFFFKHQKTLLPLMTAIPLYYCRVVLFYKSSSEMHCF